ncbi:hypothetical protein D3C71_2012100 [compost metagenome]
MRSSQSPAFEADAAEIDICLNDILHGFGQNAILGIQLGPQAIGEQRIIAGLCQSVSRNCACVPLLGLGCSPTGSCFIEG